MRKMFVNTLSNIVSNDPSKVLLLGDIGVFGFRNLLKEHPQRVYNIGILEQSMVSVAAGLANQGFIPTIHTIAPFLVERALEQIKIDLAYQKLACNIVTVGSSYDYAALGCTHHCPADINILYNVPDINLFVPGTPSEFDQLFKNNYNNGKVNYFRLSEFKNNTEYEVNACELNIVKKSDSSNIFVFYVGPTQHLLDQVINEDINIIYCTTVSPLNLNSIANLVSNNSKFLIVEPYYSGTLSTQILEEFSHLQLQIKNIGVPRKFIRNYGKTLEINNSLNLTSEYIKLELESLKCTKFNH
ncbi:hypothetical protein ACWNT8_00495 [Pigmentibacter ruber]